ncbi:MAG: AzlD domain-containing protein [Synergistetes bacterium]|nr:AzlD domain-containing protein [Synergistota bacterium]MCX8127346.1 AzlD domain-containing protein [Synergistota bacterium]MDW8192210.1 AzlD domain-containing protein [Synergistota bacterium]
MKSLLEHNIFVIAIIAILTYSARLLPLYFKGVLNKLPHLEEFLRHSSMALMSALFVTSLVSFPVNVRELGLNISALIFVFISYKKWKSLGLSVLFGIVIHWLLSVVIST